MRRRVAAVLASLLLALLTGGAPASAVSDPEEAESERAEAFELVDAAVANRAEIEGRLVSTLLAYEGASRHLAAASAQLESVSQSLVFAEASAAGIEQAIGERAVLAYMEAVSVPSTILLDAERAEHALVVGQALEAGQTEALADLDELVARRKELERLRAVFAGERERVATLTEELADTSLQLEELLGQADAELAEAFRRAREADVAFRAAVDAAARAEAAESERRRASTTSTTTSSTPATTGADEGTPPPATAPATTTPDDSSPSIDVSRRTLAWRPLIEAYFPADLVSDALVIVECESGGDPGAVNPYSGAAGLFQFLPGTWAVASVKAGVDGASPLDGEANIRAAAWLAGYYRSRGLDPWQPWHCRIYL